METAYFQRRLSHIKAEYNALITRANSPNPHWSNGLFERYRDPVLTAAHTPLFWRYDLNPETNPYLMERLGVNAVFNPGAIELDGKIILVCRVEGYDRKSFFGVAESQNGVDNFHFWDDPLVMPEREAPDTNVYDMRLVRHEDGWIYGLFCSEHKDPHAPPGDLSSAVALCGIDRTKDLLSWERLPDLKTRSPQQRNVVLCNGWVRGADDQVFIYYASSDTRIHVATSTVERLLDYGLNTPEDGLRSAASVSQRMELIRRNKAVNG
jgi:4-O-beta-D-mannosyl-D-glucose phosphorylase